MSSTCVSEKFLPPAGEKCLLIILNKEVIHPTYFRHKKLDCEVIPPVTQSWCHSGAIRKKWTLLKPQSSFIAVTCRLLPNIGCLRADTPCALSSWNTNERHPFQEALCIQNDICLGSLCWCLLAFTYSSLSGGGKKRKEKRHCASRQRLKWRFAVVRLAEMTLRCLRTATWAQQIKYYHSPLLLKAASCLHASRVRTEDAHCWWMRLLFAVIKQLTALESFSSAANTT